MTKAYKGEQTRENILKVAIRLFSEFGFDQVSLQMIGDEVGVSQAAVAQHFKNKRNIIFRVREIVTKSNQSFVDQAIDAYAHPEEQILQYCFANIDWAIKNPSLFQIITLNYYFAMFDPDFKEMQERSIQVAISRLEKFVISFSREESALEPNEIREIASSIHQMILGALLRDLSLLKKKTYALETKTQFRRMIPKMLRKE